VSELHCEKCGQFGGAWHFCPKEPELEELRKVYARSDESREVEQLRVQLAGCSSAAFGYGGDCKQGDYGWSASFGDVMKLRERAEAAEAKLAETEASYNGAILRWQTACERVIELEAKLIEAEKRARLDLAEANDTLEHCQDKRAAAEARVKHLEQDNAALLAALKAM
jgi:hypothetical protein